MLNFVVASTYQTLILKSNPFFALNFVTAFKVVVAFLLLVAFGVVLMSVFVAFVEGRGAGERPRPGRRISAGLRGAARPMTGERGVG